MTEFGVVCGFCGGTIYMETCETNGGPKGHEWVIASECQNCGEREVSQVGCLDCAPVAVAGSATSTTGDEER